MHAPLSESKAQARTRLRTRVHLHPQLWPPHAQIRALTDTKGRACSVKPCLEMRHALGLLDFEDESIDGGLVYCVLIGLVQHLVCVCACVCVCVCVCVFVCVCVCVCVWKGTLAVGFRSVVGKGTGF